MLKQYLSTGDGRPPKTIQMRSSEQMNKESRGQKYRLVDNTPLLNDLLWCGHAHKVLPVSVLLVPSGTALGGAPEALFFEGTAASPGRDKTTHRCTGQHRRANAAAADPTDVDSRVCAKKLKLNHLPLCCLSWRHAAGLTTVRRDHVAATYPLRTLANL